MIDCEECPDSAIAECAAHGCGCTCHEQDCPDCENGKQDLPRGCEYCDGHGYVTVYATA